MRTMLDAGMVSRFTATIRSKLVSDHQTRRMTLPFQRLSRQAFLQPWYCGGFALTLNGLPLSS